ncbi:HEAT repeat domain-containing protein [Streptomyces sp. CA-111067]|uniref:HEAT repeat domain-containing protein n=1 Tax=Streptomyces sp. CA-111067 TaxID=3240046 RepID=UPI003D972383
MLRRRRERSGVDGAVAAGRWAQWCAAAETGRPPEVAALLGRLRAAVAEGPPGERTAALEALGRARPRLLLGLDRYARTAAARPDPQYRPGGPAPSGPATATGTDPLRLLLASLDADGRTREAAVQALAGTGGPLATAALALRADDWVPAIRTPARTALATRTAPDEAAAALGVLIRRQGRRRADGLLAGYRAGLREHPRTVRALAAERDPLVRRFGVELALDLDEYVRGDLLRAALHDHDQVCRTLSAQRLLDLDPAQAGALLRARGAAVRAMAVAALPPDVPATRLVPPLADRARMVRAQARWQLYHRGEPPAEVYRRQLHRAGPGTPARLVAGLATGLGECGDAADAPQLMRLLADRHLAAAAPAAVRRAAVRAVGRLAKPDELVPLLGPLAADPDPGVAREVFEALARVPDAVPVETLWLGRTRTEPSVRRAAERIGGWTERPAPKPYAMRTAFGRRAGRAGRRAGTVRSSSRGTDPGR